MKKEPHIKGNLINKSFEEAFKKFKPLITTLEITQNCNFRCAHCYNFNRVDTVSAPKNYRGEELTFIEIESTIEQLSELGCLYLNISGGEALLHPKIDKIISLIRANHMEPRLKTNGALVELRKLNSLYEAGLRSLDISVYGASDETYEDFTGNKFGFDKLKNCLDLVSRFDIEVNLNIILHRANVDELKQMIELARSYNYPFAVSTEITERYDDSVGARKHEITTDQFRKLLMGEFKEHFQYDNSEKALQCGCARSVLGIGSKGEVYPCIGAPILAGNLREQSLKEIWQTSTVFSRIRKLENKDFKSCTGCEFVETCARSSGSIYTNTGNYTGCEKVTLEQARVRKELIS